MHDTIRLADSCSHPPPPAPPPAGRGGDCFVDPMNTPRPPGCARFCLLTCDRHGTVVSALLAGCSMLRNSPSLHIHRSSSLPNPLNALG
jgi:hypothetical protein